MNTCGDCSIETLTIQIAIHPDATGNYARPQKDGQRAYRQQCLQPQCHAVSISDLI